MRRSDMAAVLFLLSGFVPAAATAQQTTPDANQATQAQTDQGQQHPDQARTENSPAQPGQTQQPSQAQAQSTKVEPPHAPQQTDQLREQQRRNAEDTRINRNWTAEQQADEGMKQAEQRMRQQLADERMILERLRQRRWMEENEDHQTTGQNWRRDGDDMYRSPRYGSADRGEERDYNASQPSPRVKTCIEYENGDEFCRYRDSAR